ncbi:Dabb family protein [Pseudolysinimonas sp.]|uniref:Dabb family protein n=1 Tax=Pseudolysinimonas sp. TaxID=2680009 RepID=UPI00378308A2
MILHLVAFTWKEGVSADQVAALTVALQEMADGIPELVSYRCGENLRLRPGADYAVAAIVRDEAGLTAYLDSPAHAAVYENHMGKMLESRMAAQLPVPEDAHL